ncbi:MAG: hypothetical protein IT324_21930 [Anaerolineae bacterium]|nr:hypothetical protein [Anaerolineae bacterium]
MRQQRTLSGRWQFQLDPTGTLDSTTLSPDRTIPVPMPWQAAFPDLRQYDGYAWYRRMVDLAPDWLTGQLLLKFGAVDYWCQVYVNGQLCGDHEGGYTPFVFPIHTAARAGFNEIAVRVYDPVQTGIVIPRWPDDVDYHAQTHPPLNARDIPHGKQEWYVNAGGIWQDVTLIAVPTSYIEQAHITTDIYTGRADLTVTLTGDLTTLNGELQVTIEGTDALAIVKLEPGQPQYQISVTAPQYQLWSPESPNLYTAVVRLTGSVDDEIRTRFGFRDIKTQNGQLLLNGAPLYLLCALDQDIYAETLYTVPSEGYLRDQFAKAKALGLNSLRCHIKPPDPLYLDLADEMGLLIWEEIPSWRTFNPKTTVHPNQLALDNTIKQRVENTLIEMLQRDFNHPSIIIWTIVNEDWGTSLPLSADDRAWVARMYDLCKRLDPTRLVVDNSPCTAAWGPNIHVKSDLDDYHVYMNIPDNADNFEQFIEQFGNRPLWTYSSQGDAQRVGSEPLVLSEFGNWGLPSLQTLTGGGSLPDWFDLGPWWSTWDGEPGWPRDVLRRFEALGLNAIWSDYEDFACAAQWHQFYAMKFEIEAMRRQPSIVGYVITELSDIYWESNGLLDFNRNPKVYHDQFARFNAPDVVLAQLDQYVTWDDQPLPCRFYGSHYNISSWYAPTLTWHINGGVQHTQMIPVNVERGKVVQLGTYQLDVPQVDRATRLTVDMTLYDVMDNELARNDLPVLVLPAAYRAPAYNKSVTVQTRRSIAQHTIPVREQSPQQESAAGAAGTTLGEPHTPNTEPAGQSAPQPGEPVIVRSLASTIRQLGYDVREEHPAETELMITDYPNAETLNWVRGGGTLLYLSSGPGPFFWRQGRTGAYGGGWITSFSWLKPGVYRRLQVENPLLLPFCEIMPTGAIVGLPVDNPAYHEDFLAGQVSGWLQHPAVHTVQFRYGQGKVLMTTYPLKTVLMERGPHPLAVAMFHDLVEYVTSAACQPTLQANY